MNFYSEDLLKKIVTALEKGMPKKIETRGHSHLQCGGFSLKRYVATYREGRPLAPNKRPGSKPKLDKGARKLLEVDLKELLYPYHPAKLRPISTPSKKRLPRST